MSRVVVVDIETVSLANAVPVDGAAVWKTRAEACVLHTIAQTKLKGLTKQAVESPTPAAIEALACAMEHESLAAAALKEAEKDEEEDRGALSALTGRVACICVLVDDRHPGRPVHEVAMAGQDEAAILRDFWALLWPGDVIVGHNVLEFDLLFLRQRSWIHGIRPLREIDTRKYYTKEVVDTLQLWSNWGSWGSKKGAGLDGLGQALCGRVKSGHGNEVAAWWQAGDLDSIRAYCMDDVRLTYQVFCKLTYREPAPMAAAVTL